MTTYRLTREQLIPRPIDEVFAFFANAEKKARLVARRASVRFLS